MNKEDWRDVRMAAQNYLAYRYGIISEQEFETYTGCTILDVIKAYPWVQTLNRYSQIESKIKSLQRKLKIEQGGTR